MKLPKPSILVLNRPDAENFTGSIPYIVISISNPGGNALLPSSNNLLATLRLQFHDLTQQIGKGGYLLFTEKLAEEVFNFVGEHLAKTKLVVIHCDSGKSRSAAVAAVLSEWLTGSSGLYVRGDRYLPNPLVLKLLRQEVLKITPPS